MKALDTNVLVRFLVNDDHKQAAAVKHRFEDAERARESFLVPLPVVLELMWVLSAVYRLGRDDILLALEQLLSMAVLSFEKDELLRSFVELGRNISLDLPDLLIALCAQSEGAEKILTFDAKAIKASDRFEALKE